MEEGDKRGGVKQGEGGGKGKGSGKVEGVKQKEESVDFRCEGCGEERTDGKDLFEHLSTGLFVQNITGQPSCLQKMGYVNLEAFRKDRDKIRTKLAKRKKIQV